MYWCVVDPGRDTPRRFHGFVGPTVQPEGNAARLRPVARKEGSPMLQHNASTNRSAGAGEVVLDCPDCLDRRLFISPDCAAPLVGERVCTDCGAAVVLVEPSPRPSVPRTLRRVA
jgi:hypothetical protein